MPHTTTNLLVHFIFSTKQRCALIKPDFEKDHPNDAKAIDALVETYGPAADGQKQDTLLSPQ